MPRITTVTSFRTRFPEFSAKSDDEVDAALDIADQVNSKTNLAYYVGAHVLVTDELRDATSIDGGVYPLTGDAVGGLSNSYQLPATDGDLVSWLRLTEYGRRYLALRTASPRVGIAARVVG